MLYLEAKIKGRTKRWPLKQGEQSLGRGRECGLQLEDDSVSRRHLRLTVEKNAVHVEDLDSTNGLWLRGERVAEARLEIDQWFAAGTVLLIVREGVSFDSLGSGEHREEGMAAGEGVSAPGPVTETTGRPRREEGQAGEFYDLLNEFFRQSRGPEEESWYGLLELLGEHCGALSVAALCREGEQWGVGAQWGAVLPLGFERALVRGERGLPETVSVEGAEARLRVISQDSAHESLLVVFPWRGGAEREKAVEVVAGILSMGGGDQAATCDASGPAAAPPREAVVVLGSEPPFIAVSHRTMTMLQDLDRLAPTNLPVVLQGESGTGKELLARRLHARSPRAEGPFVAINCAALPMELLEAELFGIERGVATGVSARKGRMVLADGGTLFLDEVADLPRALQPKLLRALETLEITPLGAPDSTPVDVRIISATHQDLEEKIRDGSFRRDLLYRLAGAVIKVPPLRERPEEILPLARLFARHAAEYRGLPFRGIDIHAARRLLGHRWTGNVRELRHAITRAVALADGPILHAELLPGEIRDEADENQGEYLLGLDDDYRGAREKFERLYFTQLLQRCEGNHTRAARLAGLSRSSLYRKLEELGLRP